MAKVIEKASEQLLNQLVDALRERDELDYSLWHSGSATQPASFTLRLRIKPEESAEQFFKRFFAWRDYLEKERTASITSGMSEYIEKRRERYGKGNAYFMMPPKEVER